MVYASGGLGAFLKPLMKPEDDLPESAKTPRYYADRGGREWSLLGAYELSDKLYALFVELKRLREFEKAAKKETPDA
jgi:hypothetical protein